MELNRVLFDSKRKMDCDVETVKCVAALSCRISAFPSLYEWFKALSRFYKSNVPEVCNEPTLNISEANYCN